MYEPEIKQAILCLVAANLAEQDYPRNNAGEITHIFLALRR
jgi:hypothetical protein